MRAPMLAVGVLLLGAPAALAQAPAPCRVLCAPEFTVEAIFLPFDRDSTPELEFETNVVWLPAERTKGWLSSHFDIVDKFSPAERPTDRHAYTHKLNLELDTSLSVFNWLPEGRWLRGVELEGSLDYVATGLPKAGDVIDGGRFLDDASPWSFSVVFVLPIAPALCVMGRSPFMVAVKHVGLLPSLVTPYALFRRRSRRTRDER